jgi:hypothetical protein
VGNGEVGPIASSLQRLYFEVAKGNNPKYMDWLTPVNHPVRVFVPEPTAS